MGNEGSKSKSDGNQKLEDETECRTKYLHKYIEQSEKTGDGIPSQLKSDVDNRMTEPPWIEFEEEDKKLHEDIASKQNMETSLNISKAVDFLKAMSTTYDPVEKLSCIKSCNEHVIKVCGSEQVIPTLSYVVLKSNPPKLYSNLMYLSCFLEMNAEFFGEIEVRCVKNITDAVTILTSIDCTYYGINYIDQISQKLHKELESDFTNLSSALKALIKVRKLIRKEHGEDMERIADALDEHRRNVLIAKSVGLVATIGGSIVGIVGFGLMFTTFGVSAILIPVGGVISGAGGITVGGASLTDYGINKANATKIKTLREKYEEKLNVVLSSMQKIEKTIDNIGTILCQVKNGGQIVLNMANMIQKLVRIVLVVQDVGDVSVNVGVSAFRAASNVGRGLAIAGVAVSAALLPFDLVFLGIAIKDLATGKRAEQAKAIRAWLNEELPSDDFMEQIVLKLKTAVVDYLTEVQNNKNGDSTNDATNRLKSGIEEIKTIFN